MNSLWSTPECDAWSKGFCYNEYLTMYEKIDSAVLPVSVTTYLKLCEAFNCQMEGDMEGNCGVYGDGTESEFA